MRGFLFFNGITLLVSCMLSCFSFVQLCATPWTVAHRALLSMEFSRQECWSGLPCPPPGDLSHLGIEPASRMSPALADKFFTTSSTREVLNLSDQSQIQYPSLYQKDNQ